MALDPATRVKLTLGAASVALAVSLGTAFVVGTAGKPAPAPAPEIDVVKMLGDLRALAKSEKPTVNPGFSPRPVDNIGMFNSPDMKNPIASMHAYGFAHNGVRCYVFLQKQPSNNWVPTASCLPEWLLLTPPGDDAQPAAGKGVNSL